MVAVARGQPHQSAAVEIHSTGVQQIRVLIRKNAARPKPHLPVRLVDEVDVAHYPLAGGDGVLEFAGVRINQVQVPPAAALGHVDDFVGPLQPVHEAQVQVLGVRGPDEGLAPLVDDVARRAGV